MFRTPLSAPFGSPILGCTLAVAALCNQAQAQQFDPSHFGEVPYVLSNGVAGKPVHFPSHSPVDYGNVIAHDFGPAVTLTGQLFLPANASGPVRVVIIDPGSGNLAPNYFRPCCSTDQCRYRRIRNRPIYRPWCGQHHRRSEPIQFCCQCLSMS